LDLSLGRPYRRAYGSPPLLDYAVRAVTRRCVLLQNLMDMHFPPGDPVEGEDPRRLLDELWRAHERNRDAPYGERYVTFTPLIERAVKLDGPGWAAFERLYAREHARRRLPAGTETDWLERARSYRVGR